MATTLTDKLLLPAKIVWILGAVVTAAVTGPFRGPEGAPTYGEHVMVAGMRRLVTDLTVGQAQFLLPTFLSCYNSWCISNKLTPDIVSIPNTNIQAFWIGNKSNAKYTMLYFHGGGFTLPGSAEHMKMFFNLVKWSDNKLAILAVSYTLSPQSIYPGALSECVESLRYLLAQSGPQYEPENILLGGDSAGGNLVLAVLSHISNHPHPKAEQVKPLTVQGELRGAIAIAPWVSADTARFPSMTKWVNRDLVNPTCAHYWIAEYKGGKDVKDDEYVFAVLAEAEWWKGTKCKEMLVTAGEQEVLVDAITFWVERYRQGAGADKVKYVIGKREIHDAPLFCQPEAKLVELGENAQEGAIRLWIKEKLV